MKNQSMGVFVLVMLFSAFLGGMGLYFGQKTAEWAERKLKNGDTTG